MTALLYLLSGSANMTVIIRGNRNGLQANYLKFIHKNTFIIYKTPTLNYTSKGTKNNKSILFKMTLNINIVQQNSETTVFYGF